MIAIEAVQQSFRRLLPVLHVQYDELMDRDPAAAVVLSRKVSGHCHALQLYADCNAWSDRAIEASVAASELTKAPEEIVDALPPPPKPPRRASPKR